MAPVQVAPNRWFGINLEYEVWKNRVLCNMVHTIHYYAEIRQKFKHCSTSKCKRFDNRSCLLLRQKNVFKPKGKILRLRIYSRRNTKRRCLYSWDQVPHCSIWTSSFECHRRPAWGNQRNQSILFFFLHLEWFKMEDLQVRGWVNMLLQSCRRQCEVFYTVHNVPERTKQYEITGAPLTKVLQSFLIAQNCHERGEH